MSQSWLLVFLIAVLIRLFAVAQTKEMIAPKIIDGSDIDQCPQQEHRNAVIEEINNSIIRSLQINQCGSGEWYRIAYLNMDIPSEQCPLAWREFISDGVRTCARPITASGSCPGTLYPVSRQYRKVCGRVIGYQFGSPTAFERGVVEGRTIDEAYVEGVSITHGRNPRKHIWTYAAGSSEQNRQECSHLKCPCIDGFEPQSYVGNNYYCESAYQGTCYVINRFFPDDPLWDGQQCDNDEGTCCTGANTPPWFSVDLPDSTSDDIEVRICHDQDTTDEDTPIQLLELYIQ